MKKDGKRCKEYGNIMSDDTINDWFVTSVMCDVCTKVWLAVTDEIHEALQCPNCHQFVNFEEMEL